MDKGYGLDESVLEELDKGFCVIEVLFGRDGRASDCRFLKTNAAFERQTGLASAEGLRFRELSDRIEQAWLDAFERVAKTRKAERFEQEASALGRWYECYAFPISKTNRNCLGVLFYDITERKQQEADLRRSRQMYQALVSAGTYTVYRMNSDWSIMHQLDSESMEKTTEADDWLEKYVPLDDRVAVLAAVERAIATKSLYELEHKAIFADGSIGWVLSRAVPLLNAEGEITEWFGAGTNVTERRVTAERLRESEERLRNAVEVGKVGLWDWNVLTGRAHWSDEHYRLQGYGVGEVSPSYAAWRERVHPDDLMRTEEELNRAMTGQDDFEAEFRVLHADGTVRWLQGRGRYFYDPSGKPVRMIGAVIDTTERREWENHQKVLVAELQHRTRNLLGVIRSISERTAQSSEDLADFRDRFRSRLEALARAQGLLSRLKEHDRVTFDVLVRGEVNAMNGSAMRVTFGGPEGVRLRSSTVQMLAMGLHELATNAMKYGALSQPAGHLAIQWAFEPAGEGGKPWLHIDWRETGVEMPAPGTGRQDTGQGRELIEKALPFQLGAKTTFRLMSDGLHCTISVPVSASPDA